MTRRGHCHPRPWARGALAGAASVALLASVASAQRLNLDAPRAPAPGESAATRALRAALPERADLGPHAWIDDALLAAALRSRAADLARALLARADELGEQGSVHYALAATLARDTSWADELAAAAARSGDATIGAAARSWVHAVDAYLAESAGRLPPTVGDADAALRVLCAPLAQAAADRLPARGAAWDLGRADPPPAAAALAAMLDGAPAGAVDRALADDLRSMLGALDEASALWAFAPAAAEARATIGAALPPALGAPGALPEWFAEARRALVAERAAAALRRFAASARDGEAADALTAAAAVARLAHRADALVGGATPSREAQAFRLSLAEAAADALGDPGPARERARKALRALERVMDLLEERATIGADADLTRELRVSFRALDAAAKKTEGQLVAQLGAIARAESATSEPAIVAAIAAHRRALDDLKMLRSVDQLLSRHRDDASPTWRLASARLLRLGQEIGRAAAPDSSLVALRAFGAAMELLDPLPGEAFVRAGGAEADALTGGRAARVVARLDEWRGAYLDAWAREGDGAPGTRSPAGAPRAATPGPSSDEAAARLRALRALLTLVEDARTVRALAAPGAPREGLRAWPGVPVSARGLALAAGGSELADQLSDAAAAAIDPARTEQARRALRQIEEARPTLRLLAALDRGARSRGAAWVWPFAAAASPPTRASWMAAERSRLASIARYLDDAAATPARDSRARDALLAYVDHLSRAVLEAGLDR
jgi:hypothetical protein